MHNRGGNATVPHYVDGRSQPVYPATEGYAWASLIIHKPWHKGVKPFSDDTPVIDQFNEFIQSASCPFQSENSIWKNASRTPLKAYQSRTSCRRHAWK
jgi:hypothetical protein